MLDLEIQGDAVLLPVKARAGGRVNGATGVRQGALLVSVTQVAEKGKANKAIAAVLAKLLGCSKSQLDLVRGATSSEKVFLVSGVGVEAIQDRVKQILGDA
ncbi:DUF167 domain-containing protein [Aeoliella mucimassa]|uniref:UPF0235 protein Pan181_32710 n=1 Tax=Aeoliella mucimassa TaxID=2527972 RepID=A0A518AQR3_9BACT|nr:DUF167 domain-containing protein [Aeoliella mucimassa]QDU57057.1 hypothetical protein Pan181_32710 [Aeoliella mucimassa]